MNIQSFINGDFHKTTNLFTKLNPFTLDDLHSVQNIELMQVVHAIQGAQKFFLDWRSSSYNERIQVLEKIKSNLNLKKNEYARYEALDQGLPLQFTENHNLQATIDVFEDSIGQLKTDHENQMDYFTPTGVIVIFSSWNLSLRNICERLAPALAAGNTVIIKVSSWSPITSFILSQILADEKIPPGLIQIIVSQYSEAQEILLTHPGVKAISFVGSLKNSQAILKKIASNLSNTFKKIQIATGSKNSGIVLSAPSDAIFQSVISSFMCGQGQLAWNNNRLFLLEKFEKEWIDKIEDYLAKIYPSEGVEDSSLWTPCLKIESFCQFSEIQGQAIRDQAQLIRARYKLSEEQGKKFLYPTFTKDMSNCSVLQQDQIFAPLFIVSSAKYPFDFAKFSNVSYYGQSASIWGDEDKIEKIAEALEVAQVFKNKWAAEHYQPRKGVKQSGFGLQDYRVFGDFFSNVKKMT